MEQSAIVEAAKRYANDQFTKPYEQLNLASQDQWFNFYYSFIDVIEYAEQNNIIYTQKQST
jgi:adenosine deaminase